MAELSTLGQVIKAAYEGRPNTNAYTDGDKQTVGNIKPVATSGDYSDLSGTPSIPSNPGDIGAATAAQGAKADSAVQPADLSPYATTGQLFSGSYGDLTGKPSIPSSPGDIGAATAAQGAKADSAVQPGDLSPYAKTADLALSGASVAANVPAGGTADDIIAALVAAGLMQSA